MKSTFDIKLDGYTPANRDATVKLIHEATGATIERKPFLDGSLRVRDLEPGFYEMEVRHPNLALAIERRRVRLFPQPGPTKVTVPVPEDLFRDTPIRDIPDADLGPVQQTASDVRARLDPIGAKAPGEVIRASDWNTLVGAVQDLANGVLELTQLVSPRGHDHPEIAEKIGEVQENLRRFAEAFGQSLLELRREIETENLRNTVDDVLDAGGASEAVRGRIRERLDGLEKAVQGDTPMYTGKLSRAGSLILNELNDLAASQGDEADAFLGREDVQRLGSMAGHYSEAGTQTRAESELATYRRTTASSGGKFSQTVRR